VTDITRTERVERLIGDMEWLGLKETYEQSIRLAVNKMPQEDVAAVSTFTHRIFIEAMRTVLNEK